MHAVNNLITNPENMKHLKELEGKDVETIDAGLADTVKQSPSKYAGDPPTVS